MTTNTPPTGQVPESEPPTPGQVPTTSSADGQVPDANQPPKPSLTLDQALDALEKARKDHAATRVRLTELEKAQKAADDAKLSELDLAKKRAADLEAEKATWDAERKQARLERAIEKQATTLGLIDPEAALKLLDTAQIEYEADGTPKNLGALLTALVKAKPYLASKTPPALGATHPGRDSPGQAGTIKRSQLEDFAWAMEHEAEIKAAMREGRIIEG